MPCSTSLPPIYFAPFMQSGIPNAPFSPNEAACSGLLSWLDLLLSHLELPPILTSTHPFLKHLPPLSSKASISPASPVTSLMTLSRSFISFLFFDAKGIFPPKF